MNDESENASDKNGTYDPQMRHRSKFVIKKATFACIRTIIVLLDTVIFENY